MVLFFILNGIVYSTILAIILLGSIKINPRIWLHRYPKAVLHKVLNKTKREVKHFIISGIIFTVIMIGYPIVSTIYMNNHYDTSYLRVVLYILVLFASFNIMDTFIIDYFLFYLFTVNFIRVEGSRVEDYKDFVYHLKGGIKGLILSIPLSIILACIYFL